MVLYKSLAVRSAPSHCLLHSFAARHWPFVTICGSIPPKQRTQRFFEVLLFGFFALFAPLWLIFFYRKVAESARNSLSALYVMRIRGFNHELSFRMS
jgi:hypothetical protein